MFCRLLLEKIHVSSCGLYKVRRILFIKLYRKKLNKKDKETPKKGQRTTKYYSHIGTQQINSSSTVYLLMCLAAKTVT